MRLWIRDVQIGTKVGRILCNCVPRSFYES